MLTAKMVRGPHGLRFAFEKDRSRLEQAFGPEDAVEVTFRKWSDDRSSRQQRALHALIGAYAKAQGRPFELAKKELKYNFGTWVTLDDIVRHGFPSWKGEPLDLADLYEGMTGQVYLKSEAAYSKAEERELIDRTIEACYEIGADIDEIVRGMEG